MNVKLEPGVELFAGQIIFIEEGLVEGSFLIHRMKDHDYMALNPEYATAEDYVDLVAFCAGIDNREE